MTNTQPPPITAPKLKPPKRKPPPPLSELIKPLLGPPASLAAYSKEYLDNVIASLSTYHHEEREDWFATITEYQGADAANYFRARVGPLPTTPRSPQEEVYRLHPDRRAWMNMVHVRLGRADPVEENFFIINPAEQVFYGRMLFASEDRWQRAINSVRETLKEIIE